MAREDDAGVLVRFARLLCQPARRPSPHATTGAAWLTPSVCARAGVCTAGRRLHPVSGKFPDGSEPDSDEIAQNEDIMKQTLPAEPQPEPEPEPEQAQETDDSTRRLLVLCFILAVAYLASVGELEPLLAQVKPHLEPLLRVVVSNGPPAETERGGSDE